MKTEGYAESLRDDSIRQHHVSAWVSLEQRALSPSACLSPHFMLPAVRHLGSRDQTWIVMAWTKRGQSTDLIGVAVVTVDVGARSPCIRGFRSHHSSMEGVLLDRSRPQLAWRLLVDEIHRQHPQCYQLVLEDYWAQVHFAMAGAKRFSPSRYLHEIRATSLRAILPVALAGEHVASVLKRDSMRTVYRRFSQGRDRGDLQWRMVREPPDLVAAGERFLRLEAMGWKGEEGTALLSRDSDARFFREMLEGFAAERRIFFCELLRSGETISSSANMISAEVGYAFKIGWNPEFKKLSPGLANELEFMQHVSREFPGLAYFDSGSGPDSYINSLWTGRLPMISATHPLTPRAKVRVLVSRIGRAVSGRAGDPADTTQACRSA